MLYSGKVNYNALHRESKMLVAPNERFINLVCKSLYRFIALVRESIRHFIALVCESLYRFNVMKCATTVKGRSESKRKTNF